ncbi:MAG: cysteine desulfurase family protein [bacterium]
MKKRIYLDYAATTPVDPYVAQKMQPYFTEIFGNPSSLHTEGRNAHTTLENARNDVARVLNVQPQEILFTGSGTESDNIALQGVAHAYRSHGRHIVVSSIEHKAVLESASKLEKEGFLVTYLPTSSTGIVKLSSLKDALTPQTILVSIMMANNEIGTIQPIRKISSLIKKHHQTITPFFHTDACQAAGTMNLDVQKLGVDLLTINGSKIYGPKGVGCLYIKNGVRIDPLIVGGGQEKKRRGGTENIPYIIGFAEALTRIDKKRSKESERLTALREYFIKKLIKIPKTRLNGHRIHRLPNNIHVSFYGIEGESLLLLLDHHGVAVSTASACSTNDLSPSHVLKAINASDEWAHGSIRFTLGKYTTMKDIDYVMNILPKLVERLRNISPLQ